MKAWTRILAVTAVTGIPLMGVSSHAAAADECSATVIDGTAAQSLDQQKVGDAIRKLQDLGADVRVRTYDNEADDFWDAEANRLLASCVGWQGGDGALKTNMLVYILTPTGTLFEPGTAWYDEISESDATKIQQKMLEHSTDTDSLMAGMSETIDQLDGTNTTDAVVVAPTGAALLVIASGGVMIGARRRSARKLAQARLQEAQSNAQKARDDVTDVLGAIETSADTDRGENKSVLTFDSEFLKPKLDASIAKDLDAKMETAKSAISLAFDTYGQYKEDPATNPDLEHTVEEYESISNTFRTLLPSVQSAQQLLVDARTFYDKLEDQIERAPAALAQLQGAHQELQTLHDRLLGEGYHPEQSASLQRMAELLGIAESEITNKQHAKALDELEQAGQLENEIRDGLTKLSTIRAKLQVQHDQLVADVEATSSNLAQARAQLAELQSSYHKDCWINLIADESEISGSIARAQQAITAGAHDMSMEQQQWDAASANFAEATDHLQSIVLFVHSVDERTNELNRLAQQVRTTVQDQISDVNAAVTLLRSLRGDHENGIEALSDLDRGLVEIEASLGNQQPNYLAVDQDLQQSATTLKQILANAQAAHDSIIDAERAAAREAQRQANARAEASRQRSRPNSGGGGGGFAIPMGRSRSTQQRSTPRSSPKPAPRSSSSSSGRKSSGGSRRASGGGRKR